MKAIIKGVTKQYVSGELRVVTTVRFEDEAGNIVLDNQPYAQLPKDVDPAYFQRQANCMQHEIDERVQRLLQAEETKANEAEADAAIARMKHSITFGEAIVIRDGVNYNGKV
jgi:hypothetical protein